MYHKMNLSTDQPINRSTNKQNVLWFFGSLVLWLFRALRFQRKAFTLVELLLYVGIIALFIGAAVVFAWNVVYGRVKSNVQQEVNQNLRLGSKRIVYEVRNASGINSIGANDVCLANADANRNPTKIYVAANRLRIAWGGGSSDCTAMTNDEPLTSSAVAVSSLAFTDLSSGTESTNIKYSLTIDSSGDRKEWQMSRAYTASTEVRSMQTPEEAAPGLVTSEIQVAQSSDDAEEEVPSGHVSLGSSDLELVYESSPAVLQTVGMRFAGVGIPQGATITNSYVQFRVDTVTQNPTLLTVQGENTDSAATFVAVDGNITSRPKTVANVPWNPPPWNNAGEAGPDQRTPDISSVVQEIVNRPGWASGNALVIIISGNDIDPRTAESYDNNPGGAPLFHVEYTQ